jgi:hypothetical protein
VSAMPEYDYPLNEAQTPVFQPPLCDEEEERPVEADVRRAVESHGADVEAHSGGGFNQPS